ncbi:cysteine desulfurase [Oribacterium sp. KHPX15]|uniref:cysteine desulfurase NifS n=1 Tax=Oribacterium sp. KHPX15 TaxID=1855342 RepID=UPI0008967E97|nr:cysteine desulfurase NifS [Oribacterium sp. KHPX15]SEA59685.1 cysteine desulfurase [Oribacterium sp. KHPX15]
MSKYIYMDNAATTRVTQEVFDAMEPYFCEQFGNPSSAYEFSGKIAEKVAEARASIGKTIGASEKEIYFTGGGSESDNWAIKGVADALREKGNHIITTQIEHHAVLHTCEFLEKRGFEITYLPVDDKGLVNVEDLRKAIRPTTILISVMFANNEIGTVEPIKEIGRIAHEHGIYFHTDAVQAFGHLPIDVNEMNIDLMSASGHKINGPKGIGLLYIRKGVKITNLIHGGAQESGKRAGTTNAAGIIGFAKATEIAVRDMEETRAYESRLRDKLIAGVTAEIPYTRVNGDLTNRLSNNVNFCFRFIEGESLLIMLDQKGICASSGSACTSGSLDPSHVLLAIGLPHEIAHGSLRLTLSKDTTEEDIDYVVESLKQIVGRLRMMSPLYEDFVKKNKEASA